MSKIGWIGLGNMGNPMSQNLVAAGHEVAVWNRTKAKAEEVLAAGAAWAESPKACAEGKEFVFTCVTDGPTLQKVALGEEGLVAGLTPGAIVIDMSTVAPAESEVVNAAVEAAGCKLLRAPVTGSTILAKAGTLGVLASGDKDAYEKALPLFEKLSKTQYLLGDGEQARVLKLAINSMLACNMLLLAEAMVIAEKSGMKVEDATQVISISVVGSPVIGYKVALVNANDYKPAFNIKMMIKDLDLAFAAAKQYGVGMPATALTRQMFGAAASAGMGEMDFSAMVQFVEKMHGIER